MVTDPSHKESFLKNFKDSQDTHNHIVAFLEKPPGNNPPYYELYEATARNAMLTTLKNMYVKVHCEYIPTKIEAGVSQQDTAGDDSDDSISTTSTIDKNDKSMFSTVPALLAPLPTSPVKHGKTTNTFEGLKMWFNKLQTVKK